ncbi:four helix bundle protein [Candidatus Bipolaricaulota bacterium]|nr:four helix bundle protein [Candidatus Bipolaricaulota bacterium]
MELRTHKDLDVWKESMHLAREVYRVTKAFPKEELYGLVSQLRRAAVSVPSNIAEGAARASAKEFAQFLYTASGSLSELETQLILAKELGWVTEEEIFRLVERVRMMIFGLIRQVKGGYGSRITGHGLQVTGHES